MLERFKLLLRDMNRGIYEKETEISLSLLAALAGESVILLGPPGVAKSMVARQLKCAFRGARNFEYLMSRFSTPDEIFGPVSIQKLKTSDTYERAVEGYLPTADVVFLDEIWKAGPAIQNTLLTVINEKLFRNGIREIELPLKLLVAASNELPAKGEGLEALWDRFVIRIESRPIRQEKNFREMLLEVKSEAGGQCSAVEGKANSNAITAEEYAEWSKAIDRIGVKEEVLDAISAIRKSLRAVNVDEAAERRHVYVSDRRWKNIMVEMKNALAEDIKYHRIRRSPDEGRDYEGEIENLSDALTSLERQLGDNLFVSSDDKTELSSYLRDFYRELAFTRQDTMKLYAE